MKKGDLEHLKWLYARFVEVHKENENVDYMKRFKSIIDDLEMRNSLNELLSIDLSVLK